MLRTPPPSDHNVTRLLFTLADRAEAHSNVLKRANDNDTIKTMIALLQNSADSTRKPETSAEVSFGALSKMLLNGTEIAHPKKPKKLRQFIASKPTDQVPAAVEPKIIPLNSRADNVVQFRPASLQYTG